jgi:hypothetical protein
MWILRGNQEKTNQERKKERECYPLAPIKLLSFKSRGVIAMNSRAKPGEIDGRVFFPQNAASHAREIYRNRRKKRTKEKLKLGL